MIRPLVLVLSCLLGLFSSSSLRAQDADAVKWQNWDRIGTAMVRFKAGQLPDAADRKSPLFGALTDLNMDGVAELLVFTDPANCVPDECGTTLYGLQGDTFNDLVTDNETIRHTPIASMRFLNDTQKRYFDLAFGDTPLTFDGSHYVDAGSIPRGDFDAASFVPACEAITDNDYTIEQKGLNVQEGRAKLCSCIGERLAVLGYGKADSAILAEKLARQADDNYDNDFSNDDSAHPVIAQQEDTRSSCVVQNGWSQWSLKLGEDDEKTAQQPLEFATFIPTCARQDWLVSENKIGSPDRALSMCGCVARKLAARGYDQAGLDAIGRLYAWEINDDELAVINASAGEQSDLDLQGCLNGMPAR